MKLIKIPFYVILTILFFISVGCASSYQDRQDALNALQDDDTQEILPDEDDVVEIPDTNEQISEPEEEIVEEETEPALIKDSLNLSGSCLVNADCKSGTYCKLGICTYECNEEINCSEGLVCSSRGRCVADENYVDFDSPVLTTPPVDWYVDERVIRLDPEDRSGVFNIHVEGEGSLEYRIQVEPKSAESSVTVTNMEGSLAAGSSREITVSIDKDSFGQGDHRIAANVITDGGQKIVVYEFSNGVSGRYGGYVSYTDPLLGKIPLVVDIDVDEDGSLQGRVLTNGSLLFPVERTFSGHVDEDEGTMFLETVDVMESGGDYDPFQRNIGREIYIYGDLSEQRVLKGDFEEIISGLLPPSITVSGNVYLSRISSEVDEFDIHASPEVPGFPDIETSYTDCTGFDGLENPDVEDEPLTCAGDGGRNFRSNMITCSRALRNSAFRLGVDFSGEDSHGDPIVDFGLVEECRSDTASRGTNACVNISDLLCLQQDQQNYIYNSTPAEEEYIQYFEDVKNVQRLYSFIGNDLLIDAYRTTVEDVSNPLTLEISRLEETLEEYEKAEQQFFSAVNLSLIETASVGAVSSYEYDLFRVPLQYIRSSHSALQRLVNLILRRDFGQSDRSADLRERIQHHARVMFFEGVALANLVSSHEGRFENELAQVSDELRSISRTAGMLDAGLNPLGFASDYVPFIYDPSDALHSTNFSQLTEMSTHTVSGAVRRAETADHAIDEMELRTEEIQNQIQDIELSFEEELRRICGIGSIDLLDECGTTGGDLAVAYNDIEQQYYEIEKIHQQIMDINEMVKIKRDTSLQIMGVKRRTLAFLQSNGTQLEALDIAEAEVRAAMLKKQGLFGSIGGFFSGAASIVGGIASGFTNGGFDPASMSIGGIAGGVGSFINAGVGVAQGASNASSAMQLGRIAEQRTHLRNMQQMRFQEEGMEIAAIQSAEAVKMLLIQMAQLNLDLELSDVRLAQFVIRANNLIDRVDFLLHQRNVLLAQAINSVRNPLSNLSFRLKRDHAVLMAVNDFENAIDDVYLAARGLEHELNVNLPQIESQLYQAGSAYQVRDFLDCLIGWHDDYRIAFGAPHEEVAQLSVREDILGFVDPVTDEVTGETITPQELFRRVIFNSKYITQTGRVEYPFVTSIAGGTKQFSTLVCNDRIKRIRVMFVGDHLGDDEATVMLKQEGDSYLRDCTSEPAVENDMLNTYHLDKRSALVQAGVNDFGLSSPNYELTGRSVASDRWVLIIPTGDEAPNNADLDLLNIDDIIIEITHTARTLREGEITSVFDRCSI